MIRRYSAPVATTRGSLEKNPMIGAGAICSMSSEATMADIAMTAADRNVSRTRFAWRAPKFCPATGATAKPSATIGRNNAWTIRMPMPKPACAAAPNRRLMT